jgi:hypothetical protein
MEFTGKHWRKFFLTMTCIWAQQAWSRDVSQRSLGHSTVVAQNRSDGP